MFFEALETSVRIQLQYFTKTRLFFGTEQSLNMTLILYFTLRIKDEGNCCMQGPLDEHILA